MNKKYQKPMSLLPPFTSWRIRRILEGEDVQSAPEEKPDTSKNDSGDTSIDRTDIPKDKILKALARQLYDVLTTVYKTKYDWADKLDKLKASGATEQEVEKMQTMADDEVENLNARGTSIEEQMIAIGTASDVLAQMSEQLVAEVKNLAAKENEKFFKERSQKNMDDLEQKAKDREAEKDKKEENPEKKPSDEKETKTPPPAKD